MGVYLADPKAIAGGTAPIVSPPAEEQIEQEPVLLNKSRTRHTHTIKEREREREREEGQVFLLVALKTLKDVMGPLILMLAQ